MIILDSITYQTVVSDPSFWCSDPGNAALEEEHEDVVVEPPVGLEWQPNNVI